MGIRENRPKLTENACRMFQRTAVAVCYLALFWTTSEQSSLLADDADDLDPIAAAIRERIEDKLAGEQAMIENRIEEAERLLQRAARGEEESLAWRIDYNANLTRASRRLVESGQYDRAVETAQLVIDNLDRILQELEEAFAAGKGDTEGEEARGDDSTLEARALYLQGYLHERVFFDQDEGYRKYREALDTGAETVTASRALEKIPTRVKDRVMEREGKGLTEANEGGTP